MKERAGRIAVLDGLRALAIILVMLRHGLRPFWPDKAEPFLAAGPFDLGALFLNGWMGVDLFFILSGFLISDHLLGCYFDPQRRHMDLKTYFKRRFFRIAPAYYVAMLLVLFGLFPFFPKEPIENADLSFLYHLAFLQDYFKPDINVVFWSLGVEIKFYLLAPLILTGVVALPKLWQKSAFIAGLAGLALVIRIVSAFHYTEVVEYFDYFHTFRRPFHMSFDGLLYGMLCAVLWRNEAAAAFMRRPKVANALFFGGLFIILGLASRVPLVDTDVSFFDKTFLPAILSACFAAMALGLLGDCAAARFFSLRVWLPVALVSYSLYLIHLPLLPTTLGITNVLLPLGDPVSPAHFFAFLPVYGIGTFLLAGLLYLFVEKPCIRYAHRRPEAKDNAGVADKEKENGAAKD